MINNKTVFNVILGIHCLTTNVLETFLIVLIIKTIQIVCNVIMDIPYRTILVILIFLIASFMMY